jgi:succinate dehydrogenase hydrophobic membrane anchor protein
MDLLRGFNHWWLQRVTAVFLVIFFTIFGYLLYSMTIETDQRTILQVLFYFAKNYSYLAAFFMIVLVLHMKYGIEEVIYDYVGNEKIKLFFSILVNLLLVRILNDIFLYLLF